MAEGGYERIPEEEDPEEEEKKEEEDDDEDSTFPFQPNGASTPGPQGQQMEMKPMQQQEKSGLPEKSYTETSFSAQSLNEKAWKAAEKVFPNIIGDLEVFYTPKGRLQVKMFGQGKGKYYLFTTKKGTSEQQINPALTKKIKAALGKSIYEIEENPDEAKQIYKKIMEEKREEIKQKSSERDALEDKYGQTEQVQKLGQEIIELEKEHKEANEKYLLITEAEKRQERKKEKRQERKKEIQQEKEKQEQIANNENEDPAVRQRAREIMDDLNIEENQIDNENENEIDNENENERELERIPLKQKLKEIFKKYGVTVLSIILAAGATITTIVNAILSSNGFKAMGSGLKKLGNGLKEIGKKIASILPGLIGSIASFIFKAAGQAIGFLAEHTWLLILAVVAFLVEGYVKKQQR